MNLRLFSGGLCWFATWRIPTTPRRPVDAMQPPLDTLWMCIYLSTYLNVLQARGVHADAVPQKGGAPAVACVYVMGG